MTVQRKSVLITGCSEGGIGHALAKSFQKHGFHVFATARTPAKMSALENIAGITLLPLDVTSTPSIAYAVSEVQAQTGGLLHCLVNNAGYLYVMPALDTDLDEAKRMFDVNLWGTMAMIKTFAPLLIQAHGSVVNISSVLGSISMPYTSTYSASKAALSMASEIMRMELKPLGVKVLTIISGLVKTNLWKNGPTFKLPPASQYLPIETDVAAAAEMEVIPHLGIEADIFAESIVRDVLRRKHGTVWRGGLIYVFRSLHVLVPSFLREMIVKQKSGLDKLHYSNTLTSLESAQVQSSKEKNAA